jgi:serine/threonine protein kinase
LVESNSPEWLVKITDFGISKRALDGETDFRTNVGTSGYVAPEVIGCFSEDNQNISYSVAVDIWAIGIIAFQLLLKRLPFLSHYDIICYFDGKNIWASTTLLMQISQTPAKILSRDYYHQTPSIDQQQSLQWNTRG